MNKPYQDRFGGCKGCAVFYGITPCQFHARGERKNADCVFYVPAPMDDDEERDLMVRINSVPAR